MSNSYLTNAARIAGMGRDQGLTQEEVVDSLARTSQEKSRKAKLREAAMARRVANEGAGDFDFTGNDVPAALAGFNYGNGGEDIEFGVDQADWQVAQADDKDIVARNRRRAEQAAADIAIDQAMRGDNIIARNAVIKQLDRDRKREQNPDGRTDWRMQGGDRIKEDPFLIGTRGADQNLLTAPDKQVRFMGRVDRDKEGNFLQVRHPHREALEREPQFILGLNGGRQADDQQRREIEAERGQVRALRAQAAEREAGIFRESDVRRRIRDFEIMENANAGQPGMAANQPYAGPDRTVSDVEAVRREAINRFNNPPAEDLVDVDEFGRPKRNFPVRQGFNSIGDVQEAIIRSELAGRAVGGQAALNARQFVNAANAPLPIDPVVQERLNRMPTLRDVGNLKVKLPAKAGGFNEGQYFPEAVQDGIAPAFNASGIPLGINPPASVNIPTGDNTLNAPRDAREWLVQNQPQFKEGGRVFGDFPQVDIMGAGNDFLERIRRIKAKGQAFDPGVSAIRNINDLDAVVQNFGAFAQQGGLKMFQLDADNNEVFRSQVGLPEIFQKMKMNENAQGRLANAMFQLEIGRANGVNVPQRAAFELGDDAFNSRKRFMDLGGLEPARQVQFGARLPEFGNDEAQLQKIPRGAIQVGVDAVGEPIKQEKMAALQALSGRQAQPPLDANELRDARNGLVGLVQGEGRGRESVFGFAKRIPDGVEPRAFFREQAIERAKPGKQPNFARVRENADRWQRIVDREKAARNAPNEVLGVVGTGERDLQNKGANFPAVAKPPKAALEVDEGWRKNPNQFGNPGGPAINNFEMRREAASGSQMFTPIAQAEGGGMGGGPRPPVVAAVPTPDPWQTPPATGGGFTQVAQSSAPANTDNMRERIISSLKQGRDKFNAAPRRQRYGAAAGAALLGVAGLSSLIGGERNRREEEQYQ